MADLAVRPAYGLPEYEAAARLRHNARSAQPDVELVLEMRVTYWDQGEDAVAALWQEAAPSLRRVAIMHLLIACCMVRGYRERRLAPADVVSLVRRTIPPFAADWLAWSNLGLPDRGAPGDAPSEPQALPRPQAR
ncbi:hypothetical protein ADK60_19340 [Streptomyces sp. XY431]|uniref:hypothetical protein n=1 Tax=Streptomyces sp. XY431 TaxID=1415562 RepID=UPI0006AED0EC|nr:hypothetical protein [Streptomyces sp. XY431]KOV27860.1 hypothetical protein ADK60_19340 [Streptomyces sp. XY431]